MNRTLRCCALLLAGLLAAGWHGTADAATTCSASAGNITFLPQLGGDQATAAMDITVTCNTSVDLITQRGTTYVTACLYIGLDTSPRVMGPLVYDLYRDATYTQRWRGLAAGSAGQQFKFNYPVVNQAGTGVRTYRVHARLPAQFAAQGTYTVDFSGEHTFFKYEWDDPILGSEQPPTCNEPLYSGGEGRFPFTVTAVIPPACRIEAVPTLDFGTVPGVLSAPRDRTTDIGIRCSSGRPWKMGLDNGRNASGSTRRMLGPGGRYVQYEIYRDAARTQRWGNTPDVDTVNGTGTGAAQAVRAHGRVPAQPTPPAGVYRDTVTVRLTF